MDFVEILPHINAGLNSLATLLLITGFVLVKRGATTAHRNAMLACFGVSAVFLCCYLVYHFNVPSKPFPRDAYPGWAIVYYLILASHVLLAMAVPVLAITSIVLAIRDKIAQHKKWVRWTFPIWLYVSVTGVIVYLFLYILFPQPAIA